MIGCNIVKALNDQSINDILVVEHLKNDWKFQNLVDLDITDYMDREIPFLYTLSLSAILYTRVMSQSLIRGLW